MSELIQALVVAILATAAVGQGWQAWRELGYPALEEL